jgi:hypothetical protein
MSDSFLCRCIFTVQLAVVDSFSERLNSSMSMSYARFGEFGTQTGFVTGNGEFQDMVRIRGNAALGEKEIVSKEEGEDRRELEERLVGAGGERLWHEPSSPRSAVRTSQSHP